MNQYSRKSCHLFTFKRYAFLRKQKEEDFFKMYSHPVFRQFKFTSYCKARSSEQQFVDKVFKTFACPSKVKKPCVTEEMRANASKSVENIKDILIGWGDWGKTPNSLRGVGPTPGIGIRKRLEAFSERSR